MSTCFRCEKGIIFAWRKDVQSSGYAFRCNCYQADYKSKGIPEWIEKKHSELYSKVNFESAFVRHCIENGELDVPKYNALKKDYPKRWFEQIKNEIMGERSGDTNRETSEEYRGNSGDVQTEGTPG